MAGPTTTKVPEPEMLDALWNDFKSEQDRLKDAEGSIRQVMLVALPTTTTSAIANYVLNINAPSSSSTDPTANPTALDTAVALLAPFAFVVLFAIVVYVVWFKVSHVYNLRLVAIKIRKTLKVVSETNKFGERKSQLLDHVMQDSPANFASFKNGQWLFIMLYGVFFVTNTVLFGITLWTSIPVITFAIRGDFSNPVWDVYLLVGLFYVLPFILEVLALLGIRTMSNTYKEKYPELRGVEWPDQVKNGTDATVVSSIKEGRVGKIRYKKDNRDITAGARRITSGSPLRRGEQVSIVDFDDYGIAIVRKNLTKKLSKKP